MTSPKISIIVALDDKNGIGKENALMWDIPEELKRFRQITSGHPIIMGRKTHESIGRALPNRTNIVITRDKNYQGFEGAIIVNSLEDAIKKAFSVILIRRLAEKDLDSSAAPRHDVVVPQNDDNIGLLRNDKNEIFIIGGGQIYAQAMPLADKLYLTIVEGDFKADVFFPEYEKIFTKVISEENFESNGYKYRIKEILKNG